MDNRWQQKRAIEKKVKDIIRKTNPNKFIQDYQNPRTIGVFVKTTSGLFEIRKTHLIETAKKKYISYYMTDKIYVNGDAMVLI